MLEIALPLSGVVVSQLVRGAYQHRGYSQGRTLVDVHSKVLLGVPWELGGTMEVNLLEVTRLI